MCEKEIRFSAAHHGDVRLGLGVCKSDWIVAADDKLLSGQRYDPVVESFRNPAMKGDFEIFSRTIPRISSVRRPFLLNSPSK
jgi:hypothetical protein